jgi:hypothetical protein
VLPRGATVPVTPEDCKIVQEGVCSLALGASDEDGKRILYVCMPGSPFTGSTLLGALLNDHPDCASIGAAVGLTWRADLSTYRCSCGTLFRECNFWKYISVRTGALGHPVNVFETNFWNTHVRLSRNRLVNAALVRSLGWHPLNQLRDTFVGLSSRARAAIIDAGWNSWSLASAVLERTAKCVFVDTARDHQRPKYLARHPLLKVRVIHLIRDPRGNTASIMKHTGVDAATAARQWRHYNVEAARIQRFLPAGSWMSIHYEQLCADPSGVLDRIADFLGVRRAEAQERSANHESHLIGNKTRLNGHRVIREDLSWREKLGEVELAAIARIAGPTSHRLGFSWP